MPRAARPSYSVDSVRPVNGLEYFFHNVTIAGHDSGWQSDVTYVDKSLSANTLYTYEVKARVAGDTAESATRPRRQPLVHGRSGRRDAS